MTYETLSQAVSAVITTISNAAVASVKALKKNRYDVTVKNPVTKMTVAGTVIVGNQKNLESLLKNNNLQNKKWFSDEAKRIVKVQEVNPVKELKVTNLRDIDLSLVEMRLQEANDYLRKLPTELPTEFQITNQPLVELNDIVDELKDVAREIKKLKLDPKITVQPTPVTVTPPVAPTVNVKETKIDYAAFGKEMLNVLYGRKPKEHLNVRLTDGTKFYEAMKEMVTISSGGTGNYAYKSMAGERTHGRVDASGAIQTGEMPYSKRVLKVGQIEYIAQAVPGTLYTDAGWQCAKVDSSNSNDIKITWAGAGLFNQTADDLPSLTYA